MLPVKAPRDPAPSRVKYRLERLWLRPTIRYFVRVGLPLIAAAGLGLTLASDPAVRTAAMQQAAAARDRIAAHPSLQITDLSVPDASAEMVDQIHAALDLQLPASSMDLSLPDLRARVVALDAVATADLRLDTDGALEIRVVERVPAFVWRGPGGLFLLDAGGHQVGALDGRAARADLTLLVGAGADAHIAEVHQLLALAEPLKGRIRAVARIGNRRWDLVLDRDQVIKLPEEGAVSALARVMALDGADDILERDVTVVDMRDSRRPTLRLNPHAVTELRRLRGTLDGDDV